MSATIALSQINTTVGDLEANAVKIRESITRCGDASIIVFPEMTITGYPIEDLTYSKSLFEKNKQVLAQLALDLSSDGYANRFVLVGFLDRNENDQPTNSAALLHGGKVIGTYAKHHLPNYGVFDEHRIFAPGNDVLVQEVDGTRFGVAICEDIWQEGGTVSRYINENIDVLLVLNGSPYEIGKRNVRTKIAANRARELNVPVLYVNLVGGQDELVFDGASFIVDAQGDLIAQANAFQEDVLIWTVGDKKESDSSHNNHLSSIDSASTEEVYGALVLGLGDYVRKNGFRGVTLGMSGGIDSALCAAIAADAIGGENIVGVSMPSMYSSDHSKDDAAEQMRRNGGDYRVEPIGDLMNTFTGQMPLKGVALENLQARLRGVILMGISNSEGQLVLATGNKSELTTGYSTIYGDAVGGYAPLKDIAKTRVWELCRWRNEKARKDGQVEPIPHNVIIKPPSAELAPGQVDTDSLPPYELLDAIQHDHVEKRLGREELLEKYPAAAVERVLSLIDRAEWKRRQYPPGCKVTNLAYGRDRRVPITTKWRG